MATILEGVRILEVAEHTFVPAASAVLSDLGAEVIKIEHVTRGDAMRGLASSGIAVVPGSVHVLLEHSNRGKKSLGLDLTVPDGIEILYKLAATSDVFLTNKLPSVRRRLKIDVDSIRAANPDIIYVRGTGQGERGPEADKGSYDSLAFWARAGVAIGARRPEYDLVPVPPAPGFGDSIGGMTIAGGIMGALFHRERTGRATVVDVSLLGTGLWAMGQAMALSLVLGMPWTAPPADRPAFNPLTRNYETKDGRLLAFTCLQPGRYWPLICDAVGRPELKGDPRFADPAKLMENTPAATAILEEVFASATLEEWCRRLASFEGQWCVVQDTLEAARDPQTIANGYLQECQTANGTPFRLVAAPVQYDEQPAVPARAPEFNEHGDQILEDLGLDWDAILDLKARGVVA
jgi:crotonobetainyl-CoA:carnitine CoA-transferase CaiB-like acyl-CoA transferase